MKHCPGCGYLVPAGWDTCKRCGASLAGVAVPDAPAAAVGAGPEPTVPSGSPPRSAPPAARRNSMTHRRPWKIAVAALVVLLLLAVGGGLWGANRRPRLGATVRSYIDGKAGVDYRSAGNAFRAVLPVTPIEVEEHITVAHRDVTLHIVSSNPDDRYAVVVATADVPGRTRLAASAPVAARALSAGGAVTRTQPSTQDGRVAIDLDVQLTHGAGARLRAFMVSKRRLVIAGVVSAYRGTPGFERVLASLRVPG